ncbi:MAG: hypothetical protein JWN72_614, partial [Thermoleophilia bacterium]|nr:hypothetical protein [Thermoleophilia bacterium]
MARPATPALSSSPLDTAAAKQHAVVASFADTPSAPRWRTSFITSLTVVAAVSAMAWILRHPPAFDVRNATIGITLLIATLVGVRTQLSMLGGAINVSGETIPLLAGMLIAPDLAVPAALLTVYFAPGSRSVRALGGSQILIAVVAATWVSRLFGLPQIEPGTFLVGAVTVMLTFLATSSVGVVTYERIVWRSTLRSLAPTLVG